MAPSALVTRADTTSCGKIAGAIGLTLWK